MQWKPGEEGVTLYIPIEGLEPGDQVSLDGDQGVFLELDETGIIKLDINGNIQHYQGDASLIMNLLQ